MKAIRQGPANRGPFAGPVLQNNGTGEVTRAPLFVTAPWKGWTAPDIFPNIAALIVATGFHAPVEPAYFKAAAPQIDLPPNIAALVSVEPPKSIPAPIEPQIWTPRQPVPDILPNLAVKLQTIQVAGRYLDPPLWLTRPPVPEVLPNIPALIPVQGYVPPPMVEPAIFRRQPIPDVYQPLYANVEPVFVPVFDWLQVRGQRWAAPDILPNIAVLAVPPQAPLAIAVEPWINKRYAPQVEVFQNRAIYAPAEAPIMLQALNEPVLWKVRFQFEQPQNLAVLVPVVAPTGLHQVNMGVTFGIGMGRMGTIN